MGFARYIAVLFSTVVFLAVVPFVHAQTQPDEVVLELNQMLDGGDVTLEELRAYIDFYADIARSSAADVRAIKVDYEKLISLRASALQAESALQTCLKKPDDVCEKKERAYDQTSQSLNAFIQSLPSTVAAFEDDFDIKQSALAAMYLSLQDGRRIVNTVELSRLSEGTLEYVSAQLRHAQAERQAATECKNATSSDTIDCDVFFDATDQQEFYNLNNKVIQLRRNELSKESVNVGLLLSVSGGSTYDNLTELISTVINALTLLIGTASLIFIVVGGFRMVVSAGDDTELTRAKEMVKYAVIGLVITLLAYIIVVAVQTLIYR